MVPVAFGIGWVRCQLKLTSVSMLTRASTTCKYLTPPNGHPSRGWPRGARLHPDSDRCGPRSLRPCHRTATVARGLHRAQPLLTGAAGRPHVDPVAPRPTQRRGSVQCPPHDEPSHLRCRGSRFADDVEAGAREHHPGAVEGHREVQPVLTGVDRVGLDCRRPLGRRPGDGSLQQRSVTPCRCPGLTTTQMTHQTAMSSTGRMTRLFCSHVSLVRGLMLHHPTGTPLS